MAQPSVPKKFLVIDTDAGVDDAVAISIALKMCAETGFELPLITTSFGNVDVEQVTTNVCKTIEKCGHAATTVGEGVGGPLKGGCRLDATYFHGEDGLGNHTKRTGDDGASARSRLANGSASERFLELCRKVVSSPIGCELVLVTLGPLTNLASFLATDRLLCLSAVSKLYIMGGCSNGRGNCTRTGEFNICADPEAADTVFGESLWRSISVVPWELCVTHPIPWAVFDACVSSQHVTDLGAFIRDICHAPYVANREREVADPSLNPGMPSGKRSATGAVICDALCIVVALDFESVVADQCLVHVAVELNGTLTRGTTVVDFGHSYDLEPRDRTVRWITAVNTDVYANAFKRLFQ